MPPVPFSVMFVCTGNICRSPVAEKLFRAGLAPGADVAVSSAGTHGLSGWEIDQPSALVLRELGVDPGGHSARRIGDSMLRTSDLVLTAAAEHLGIVLRSRPALMSRTFTMREFARLARAVPRDLFPVADDAGGLRARVAVIAARRGVVAAPLAGADDIVDPFGASLDVTRTTIAVIAEAVEGALAALRLSRSDAGIPAAGKRDGR